MTPPLVAVRCGRTPQKVLGWLPAPHVVCPGVTHTYHVQELTHPRQLANTCGLVFEFRARVYLDIDGTESVALSSGDFSVEDLRLIPGFQEART